MPNSDQSKAWQLDLQPGDLVSVNGVLAFVLCQLPSGWSHDFFKNWKLNETQRAVVVGRFKVLCEQKCCLLELVTDSVSGQNVGKVFVSGSFRFFTEGPLIIEQRRGDQ